MRKNLGLIIFLGIILVFVGLFLFQIKKEKELLKSVEGKMIFFYGITCPHCAKVEEFFKENKIEEKFQFEKKEVYKDKTNAKILILIAKKKCSLPDDKIGVPFFWTGENCIVGDEPIINYFKEKISLK
jgi:glutaredoxin